MSYLTIGTFWGDPHFITLDGRNFTFNGLGEYTLLHVDTSNITLDIQARTERALKNDGSLSDATVFSAFAVKESSNASLHVQLNKAKSGTISKHLQNIFHLKSTTNNHLYIIELDMLV